MRNGTHRVFKLELFPSEEQTSALIRYMLGSIRAYNQILPMLQKDVTLSQTNRVNKGLEIVPETVEHFFNQILEMPYVMRFGTDGEDGVIEKDNKWLADIPLDIITNTVMCPEADVGPLYILKVPMLKHRKTRNPVRHIIGTNASIALGESTIDVGDIKGVPFAIGSGCVYPKNGFDLAMIKTVNETHFTVIFFKKLTEDERQSEVLKRKQEKLSARQTMAEITIAAEQEAAARLVSLEGVVEAVNSVVNLSSDKLNDSKSKSIVQLEGVTACIPLIQEIVELALTLNNKELSELWAERLADYRAKEVSLVATVKHESQSILKRILA